MSLALPPALGDPPESDPPDPKPDLIGLVDDLAGNQRRVNALAAERYRTLDALRLRWEDEYGASMSADPSGIRFRSLRARSLIPPFGADTGSVFLVGGSVVVLTAAALLPGRR